MGIFLSISRTRQPLGWIMGHNSTTRWSLNPGLLRELQLHMLKRKAKWRRQIPLLCGIDRDCDRAGVVFVLFLKMSVVGDRIMGGNSQTRRSWTLLFSSEL